MIENLLAYQVADARLRKIETELSNSEERKKAVSAKKYIETAPENVNKLDDRAADLEAELAVAVSETVKIREQLAELESALASVEDGAAASYLIKKADELVGTLKFLDGKIAQINTEMQALLKEFSAIKASTKAAQAQYAEFGKKYNDLKASKKDEKDAVENELATLKSKVDPALMERYMKKRANKIYPILFEVTDNVCGACNMELSMAELGKLKNGEVIDCEMCGRMLYVSKK